MKVQGEFKMQAHRTSSVVVDIAAFKVSHSVLCDIDATALRAERARSSSIGAMEKLSGMVQMQGRTYCDAKITSTRATTGQFKGQFKERRWMKVQGMFKRRTLARLAYTLVLTSVAAPPWETWMPPP